VQRRLKMLVAKRALDVLLFSANWLLVRAKRSQRERVDVAEEAIRQINDRNRGLAPGPKIANARLWRRIAKFGRNS
jgi:hypothetical protein